RPLVIEEVAPRPVQPHEVEPVADSRKGVPLRSGCPARILWHCYFRPGASGLYPAWEWSFLGLYWRQAQMSARETVLVTAAAGATGLAMIDVATNILQAKVIAAAGSDEKCQLAMQRGAQSSVNYSRGSLKEAVGKLVGSGGVNVVVDMVGGDVFLEALRRMVVIGFAGGTIASVPANLLLLKNVTVMGLYWGRYRHQNFPIFSRSLSSAL
ncbi:hypothetical protein Celaphus_00011148, partial [Cervus elaphus hippelaphus]